MMPHAVRHRSASLRELLRLSVPLVAAAALACATAPPAGSDAPAAVPVESTPSPAVAAPTDGETGAGERAATTGPASPLPGAGETTPRQRAKPGDPVRRELIVIDPGTSQTRPEAGELARRTGAVRTGAAPRVTNENLDDFGSSGQVTIAGPGPAEPSATAEAEGSTAVEHDEAYWRRTAREIREEWRRTLDEIDALEESAADLRWRFYAADDPWVRDGQIKPEWDQALDRLHQARRSLADYPRRLEELTERGRAAGALPGWLREGIELEPRDEELPDSERDPAEPVEPPTVDEGDGRDPGGAR